MDLPVYGGVELMGIWAGAHGLQTTGFNKGGTACRSAVSR